MRVLLFLLGAISSYPLYLYLPKGGKQRMPFLSGLKPTTFTTDKNNNLGKFSLGNKQEILTISISQQEHLSKEEFTRKSPLF